MFDPVGSFTKQFTPVDGGYLYYPSRNSGGKFVTTEEYQQLVADWQRVAGFRGIWKTAGLLFVALLLWTIISEAVALPDWTRWIAIVGCVLAVLGSLFRASLAPRRLVKDRPDSTEPRTSAEARQHARATLNWPFVIFATLTSGGIFLASLSAPEPTMIWWAWLIGSGFFFVLYLWLAFEKLRDRWR